MTKRQEFRQKLFDYFKENNIDYDPSQATAKYISKMNEEQKSEWNLLNNPHLILESYNEPEQTEEPEPEQTKEPEPEQTEEPEPEQTEEPELEQTEEPEPEQTEEPEPEQTEEPEPSEEPEKFEYVKDLKGKIITHPESVGKSEKKDYSWLWGLAIAISIYVLMQIFKSKNNGT
jgi:hypothetical protein